MQSIVIPWGLQKDCVKYQMLVVTYNPQIVIYAFSYNVKWALESLYAFLKPCLFHGIEWCISFHLGHSWVDCFNIYFAEIIPEIFLANDHAICQRNHVFLSNKLHIFKFIDSLTILLSFKTSIGACNKSIWFSPKNMASKIVFINSCVLPHI